MYKLKDVESKSNQSQSIFGGSKFQKMVSTDLEPKSQVPENPEQEAGADLEASLENELPSDWLAKDWDKL